MRRYVLGSLYQSGARNKFFQPDNLQMFHREKKGSIAWNSKSSLLNYRFLAKRASAKRSGHPTDSQVPQSLLRRDLLFGILHHNPENHHHI